MATRRRKITRSAVRRVKRRESKNAKLRSLRSRKNSSKRMRVKQMGGGDDFRIFMVYCVKKPSLECPDRMNRSNLVGTICYYPKNGEFYFCGYDTFPVKHIASHANSLAIKHDEKEVELNKRNRMMVFKIICKLCGITEGSNEYKMLLEQIEDKDGIFIDIAIFADKEKKQKIKYGPDEFGKLIDIALTKSKTVMPLRYDKHVRYCIKLSSGFTKQMTLNWIKYIVEVVYNPEASIYIPVTNSKRKTNEIKICTFEGKPDALGILESTPEIVVNNKPSITLFEDGENAVLLNALTEEEVTEAKTYNMKAIKEYSYSGEVFSHFGMIGMFVSDDDVLNKAATLYRSIPVASDAYKTCLTPPPPSQ
jgi:hypothetical protein